MKTLLLPDPEDLKVPGREPLPGIVFQHAEEAAFLWELRRRAVHQPHYDLGDLVKLDGRLEAHLDGLRVAGSIGLGMAEQQLAKGGVGELFVLAVLSLEQADKMGVRTTLSALSKKPEMLAGLVSALGWVGGDRSRTVISELLRSPQPVLRAAGIRACAVNRQHPGPALEAALRAKEPLVAGAAARAAGELGCVDLVPVLESHLGGEPGELRFLAAWSAALLGSIKAVQVLAGLAEEPGLGEAAASTAGRTMDARTRSAWLSRLTANPALHRQAVAAAAAGGDPAGLPWLLGAMKVQSLARLAGGAFTTITGLDLAYHDLDGEAPEEFEAGPTDDPEDEDVAPDPDENLPWPDPKLVAGWWQKHAREFPPGKRFLAGKPMERESLRAVLRDGKQLQRLAAAEELVLLGRGEVLFECRAPGGRQRSAAV